MWEITEDSPKEEIWQAFKQLREDWKYLTTPKKFRKGEEIEELVALQVGGVLSKRNSVFDFISSSGARVEVKYSDVVQHGKIKRWRWGRPFGSDMEAKDYEYLLCVGKKDLSYSFDYPDTSPFVYFFIPKDKVMSVCVGRKASSRAVQTDIRLGKYVGKESRQGRLLGFLTSLEDVRKTLAG